MPSANAASIGKQAVIGAGLTAGLQGTRILARRVWNKVLGKENPAVSQDLKEFFSTSVKSASHVGVQVAVSGAVVVAVKNGLLGKVLQGSPAGHIVNAVHVGMENAKILYKLAIGEMNAPEALDVMGAVTVSTIGGFAGAGMGLAQGALWGSAVGPVGTLVGGFVGGVVGGLAGNKIGEAVYSGGKAIVRTAANVTKAAWKGTKNAVSAVASKLNPLNLF